MKGLLLLNLGTPDAATTGAVRRYLRSFLSDPRVIDLPAIGRFLLLNLVILPFRPRRSAEAYRKIWGPSGSPLLLHGRSLSREVDAALGEGWKVLLAMRYGNPSIESALRDFDQAGVREIVVIALFPQYASSTTGSALEAVYQQAGSGLRVPALSVVDAFYNEALYLDAQSESFSRALAVNEKVEHLVFSFHGLPERHLQMADPTGAHCLATKNCCATPSLAHATCYRHQCFATAKALATRLGLNEEDWSVAFQSRLGRTPWLQPYTEAHLEDLAHAGKKRVGIASASFVADCLETLEELGMRAREVFLQAGGEELVLLPAMNAEPEWVEAVAEMARRRVS